MTRRLAARLTRRAFCARAASLGLLGVTQLAPAATGSHAAARKRVLRSADVHPEDFPTVQAVLFMSQLLEKATAERLRIHVFHSGLLGDEAPLLDLVKAGKLDMTRISVQALDNISAAARVLSLPYLFRDGEHLHRVLDGPIGQEIMESLRPQGLVGLAFYDAGVRNVYASKKPIRKLEDMRDLTIRVQPSALASQVFELLGARPVRLPFVQTGRALTNHIVEAAENNTPSYSSEQHYRVAPFYSMTRHAMPPDILVISRAVWDALSRAEQDALRKAAQESVTMMRDMWAQREERVEASLRLAGIQFSDIAPGELARFASAMEPVYGRFAGEAGQQDLIKRIRAVK